MIIVNTRAFSIINFAQRFLQANIWRGLNTVAGTCNLFQFKLSSILYFVNLTFFFICNWFLLIVRQLKKCVRLALYRDLFCIRRDPSISFLITVPTFSFRESSRLFIRAFTKLFLVFRKFGQQIPFGDSNFEKFRIAPAWVSRERNSREPQRISATSTPSRRSDSLPLR